MYKKVTHHIIEEHFDHPMAAHVKDVVDHKHNTTPIPHGHKSMMIPMSASSIKLNSDAMHLFGNYFWRLRAYLISALDSGEDRVSIENHIFTDIINLGNVVKMFYGDAAATAFEQYLKSYSLAIIAEINAIKAGQPTTDLAAKVSSSVTDLANFLSQANPSHWPASTVSHILNQASDAWIAQANDRKRKDWIADFAALERAKGIMLTGQSDKTPGFATIFANGVIQQFPNMFVS